MSSPPPTPPAPPPQHAAFTTWARTAGVTTHSIVPTLIPGAGLGITSTTPIPSGTVIAFCPRSLLLNISTVPLFSPTLPPFPPGTRTHAILAAAIALSHADPKNPWAAWIPTFPSREDLRGLPLFWDKARRARLPASARRLLSAMEKRMEADEAAVRAVCGVGVGREVYQWAWAVVNTRTLFYPGAGGKREDKLTLCPFVDYFNHTSRAGACSAVYGPRGYTVTTTRDVAAGEELCVTYGPHSGDFLLVEYGFVPEENEADALLLDPWLERLQGVNEVRERLELEGYWGNWVLDGRGWCYRTEVAIRLVVGDEGRWYAFLGGDEGGAVEAARVKGVLRGVLKGVLEEADEVEAMGAEEEDVDAEIEETIRRRWRQIRRIVGEVLEKT
ncbi:SET domain-containing protein [Tricharina praecox]|uniref:SET domain-containing protein n=1 Tax=Tricharina praecox TaxID=43433 RepID=UPI00221FF7DE|nr:SET domain-containing protein [Tricharina praecox]KAI5852386.1 SET domain-containing protein [Tricharina praecox]